MFTETWTHLSINNQLFCHQTVKVWQATSCFTCRRDSGLKEFHKPKEWTLCSEVRGQRPSLCVQKDQHFLVCVFKLQLFTDYWLLIILPMCMNEVGGLLLLLFCGWQTSGSSSSCVCRLLTLLHVLLLLQSSSTSSSPPCSSSSSSSSSSSCS